jgi:hypothetical protein
VKLYLAGPMAGIPGFNFPQFRKAAAYLRAEGHSVFSPDEKDEDRYGAAFAEKYTTGDIEQATKQGFSLREALAYDTTYICQEADGIAMLPGWENSKGAFAEWALARALGLYICYLSQEEIDTYAAQVFVGSIVEKRAKRGST